LPRPFWKFSITFEEPVEMVNDDEATLRPPSVAVSVYVPAVLTERLLNVATPLTAFAVAVLDPPANTPPLSVSVTVSPAMWAPVILLLSTADTVPASAKSLVPAFTVSVVGVKTLAVDVPVDD